VHVEKRVVHGRAAAAIRFAADVVVPMAAVTVIASVVRVRAVIVAAVLQVHGRGHAVTVQVRVAQTVRRRDDDGRLGRLRMVMIVIVVMMVMVVTVAADVGRHLIVRAVTAATVVVRPVIGRRRGFLVVDAALGRVRRLQRWPTAFQTLRHVVVGNQAAAVIFVRGGRRVRRVRHHFTTAAANNTAIGTDDVPDAAATDHAARVVVHSHVSRLRTTNTREHVIRDER